MALLPLVYAICATLVAAAPFRLASIFQNNMVIQRDAPIPVWGWSSPGAEIYGTLWRAGDNTTVPINTSVTANADGLFILTFPAQVGSSAYRLIAVSTAPISPSCLAFQHYCRGAYFTISVVFGDVILCTGQSNMQVDVGFAFNASAQLAAANSYTESIRLFQVSTKGMALAVTGRSDAPPISARAGVRICALHGCAPGRPPACLYPLAGRLQHEPPLLLSDVLVLRQGAL